MHSSITQERIEDASYRQMSTTDNPGFCTACGADHDGCEPDASGYECYECGERAVEGVDNILLKFV